MPTSTSGILVDLLRPFGRIVVGLAAVWVCAAAWWYPSQTDPKMPARRGDSENYYEKVYSDEAPVVDEDPQDEYAAIAKLAAENADVEGMMKRFAARYGLQNAKVLEVGAGRGRLQDVVEDYTGLDIAGSSRRFFHKRFVQASATAMPFDDSSFDAVWSIWVFEHVPNPEHALLEARRVVKDGGLLLMMPAFECGEWLADGYMVRPYSDFGLAGKAYKTALPAIQVASGYAKILSRTVRSAQIRMAGGPSQYHYRLLKPNYKKYWQADSDALNHLDYMETAAWFESRGDECLNCAGFGERLTTFSKPLIIRVHKTENVRRAAR